MATLGFEFDEKAFLGALEEFAKLDARSQLNAERAALRDGLKDLEARAKALAPGGQADPDAKAGKRIKESFSVTTRRKGRVVKGFMRNTAPHAHLMENGWFWKASKRASLRGKPIGRPYEVGPRPFMRPAFAELKGAVVKKLSAAFVDRVLKAARRAARKAKRAKK